MSIFKTFWADECGVIVSAELVTIATLGVVGMTVGLNQVASSVNGELTELSKSIRGLNQSYCVQGFSSCRAWTAGSSYTQPAYDETLCVGAPPAGSGAHADPAEAVFPVEQPAERIDLNAPATPATEKVPAQEAPASEKL